MRPQKRSKVEHSNVGTDEDHSNYAYYLREEGRVDSGGSDDAESKRGLTDGIIMQTVDYSVEFEGERDGSRR